MGRTSINPNSLLAATVRNLAVRVSLLFSPSVRQNLAETIIATKMADFIAPKLSLDPTAGLGIRTLPALVDFHADNNPGQLFCLQVKKDNHSEQVSYERFSMPSSAARLGLKNKPSVFIHPWWILTGT